MCIRDRLKSGVSPKQIASFGSDFQFDPAKKPATWMHDMYEKGYIDPEIITMDYASFVPKLAQNEVASFYGPLGGMLAAQNATMRCV